MGVIRVHQVLATLGYGDAIGHEVLGIQRVLRAAGYDSEIFVETADSRLESLTRDFRELVDFSHPDNLLLHHFSLGSKASRTAFALPDRMALIYHNITPPEYFVGVHRTLARQCFRGRRELRAYASRCDLALGDSEFNRQDLEALGFPRTAVLPVVPDFSHLDRAPNWLVAQDFDDDWTNILFVGRVIANKKIENLIRYFHAYHTSVNPRSRLLIVGAQSGFERYLASLHQLTATLGTVARSLHRSCVGRGTGGVLRAGGSVPVRQRARRLLRAPGGGVLQTGAGARVRRDGCSVDDGWRRRPVRRHGSHARGALMDAILSDAALQDRIVDGQLAAVDRLRAQDFAGTLRGFVDQILSRPRAPHPAVAFDFWQQFDAAQELEELRLYRPSIYKALPA